MNKPINILILVSLLLFCSVSVAVDFEQGIDAVHKQDYMEAYKIFHELAEQGDPDSQYNLAILLREGKGIMQNEKEAANWFRRAAEQGLADAQYDLGNLYEFGVGVEQSYENAALWYKKSAEQGNPMAQTNLGVLYANGQGVKRDIVLAYVWSNLAAAQGVMEALENRQIIASSMSPEMINRVKEISREYFQRYVAPYQSEESKRPGRRRAMPPPPQ